MKTRLGMIVCVLGLISGARTTSAGALDTSFAGDGIVRSSVFGAFSLVGDTAVQPTGEIVAVGYSAPSSFVSGSERIALLRVLADGTTDPSFGSAGRVALPTPGGARGRAVLLQPDGGIVVAGDVVLGGGWVVSRFLANGTADPGFGTGGVTITTLLPGGASDAVLAPDGTITAIGSAGLQRYTASGALDPTFGTAGVVTFPTGFAGTALARQPDGLLVVGGQTLGANTDFWVARYDATGAPDPTFGTGGTVTTPIGTANDFVTDLLLQPDGRIVVLGLADVATGFEPAFARYLADGTLDATFGTGGATTLPDGVFDSVGGIALDAGGRILAGGSVRVLPDPFFGLRARLVRLLPDGSVDATFSATPEVTDFSTTIASVAVQDDGRIVTGGFFAPPGPTFPFTPTTAFFELRRYFADGSCGNGVVEPGELCDPATPTPCCTSQCTFAPTTTACASDGNPCTLDRCDGAGACAHPPAADGASCSDGSLCTDGDACSGGACVGTPVPIDQLCATCDPAEGIAVRPRTDCKATLAPRKAALRVKHRADGNHRLTWRWRGEATTLAELGDVQAGAIFESFHDFCVFDESGPTPTLVVATGAEPDGPFASCASPPCWRVTRSRIRYRSNPPNPLGVANMTLTAGAAGRAKTGLKARGPALFTTSPFHVPAPPPYGLPVRAQLWARDGACWEATFSASGVRRNGTDAFEAASD